MYVTSTCQTPLWNLANQNQENNQDKGSSGSLEASSDHALDYLHTEIPPLKCREKIRIEERGDIEDPHS